MKYNPKIHNRRSVRLKEYDYSQDGAYFITICCYDKACLFGEIINGEMILNAYGKIAYNEWLKTTEIRSNVELDVFVIMPNHIHGIIIINNCSIDGDRGVLHTPCLTMHEFHNNALHKPCLVMDECINEQGILETTVLITDECNMDDALIIQQGVCNTPLRKTDDCVNEQNKLKTTVFNSDECHTSLRSPSNTIGSMVRGYKSAVTRQMNIFNSGKYDLPSMIWQRSYYEHIIRDAQSYQNIVDYIVNNPSKWDAEKFR